MAVNLQLNSTLRPTGVDSDNIGIHMLLVLQIKPIYNSSNLLFFRIYILFVLEKRSD